MTRIADDELSAVALSIVEAVATRDTDLAAHALARMDADELRRLVPRLPSLVDLRARVGDEDMNTAEWARWLREQALTL